MRVYCISGKAGSGKDTLAQLMKDELECSGYHTLITHYADLLKHICKHFFGWNGVKDVQGRAILQYVGTDVIREKDPDYWVNFIATMLKMFDGEWDVVLIPDCRFENEIEVLRADGFDVSHIRVQRNDFESILTEEQMCHASETALDSVKPDHFVFNDGDLDTLRFLARELLKKEGAYLN